MKNKTRLISSLLLSLFLMPLCNSKRFHSVVVYGYSDVNIGSTMILSYF